MLQLLKHHHLKIALQCHTVTTIQNIYIVLYIAQKSTETNTLYIARTEQLLATNHRLNGSSSHVLTATALIY